jgi:2-octaprenyl-6-methoxyphenol hydroxylase
MNYEVVIVGGGLTGLSLAWALHRHNVRTALVESAPFAPPQARDANATHYDDRVIALSYGSYQFYQQNQIDISPIATPIRHIHISDRGHFGAAYVDAQDIQKPALGFVVEAKLLGFTLQRLLQTQSSVDLIAPQTVIDLKLTADETAQLQLQNGEFLHTKLVILADGGQSPLYQQLNIHFETHDYQQTAIIANVTPSKVKKDHAFERFTNSGPLALLPMRNNNYALVWTVKPEQVENILNLQDVDFLKELQQAFGWRLGQFLQVGKRSAFPLKLRFTKDFLRSRLLLMGNAAHVVHPVGGQGLNLGIRDISSFIKLLKNKPQDIGSLSFLQTYANQRDPDVQETLHLTDGLVKLFSNDFKPVSFARNLGLLAFDRCPILKEKFARQMAGL